MGEFGALLIFCYGLRWSESEYDNCNHCARSGILAAEIGILNHVGAGGVQLGGDTVPAVGTQQLCGNAGGFCLLHNQRHIFIIDRDEQYIRILAGNFGQLALKVHIALGIAFLGNDLQAQLICRRNASVSPTE